MVVIGSRRHSTPLPPHVVREQPIPSVVLSRRAKTALSVVATRLPCPTRHPAARHVTPPEGKTRTAGGSAVPDALVAFELEPDGGSGGTQLRRPLSVAEPAPDDALIGHLRKRMNQLVNADLRSTFGQ